MSPRFWRVFKVVAAIHVAVISAVLIAGNVRSCGHKQEYVQPVEFLVEVPASLEPQPDSRPVVADIPEDSGSPDKRVPEPEQESAQKEQTKESEPESDALKPPVRDATVKPPSERAPRQRPRIEISTTPIVRRPGGKPSVAPLSEEQIRKLMAMGAKPSDRTVIPDESDICFGLVRKAYYDAWLQPSREEIGDASAEVSIRLGTDGTVMFQELKRPSGIAALDSSVLAAARQVRRIQGLTPEFISRHPTVTVLFKLE